MASPTSAVGKAKARNGRRYLVQPVLPALPLNPKAKRRTKPNSSEGDSLTTGATAEIGPSENWGPSLRSASPVSDAKEGLQNDPPQRETIHVPNGVLEEGARSPESLTSLDTLQAASAAEFSSAPASESATTTSDQVKAIEDSGQHPESHDPNLGSAEHDSNNALYEVAANLASPECAAFTPADSFRALSPSSNRSREEQSSADPQKISPEGQIHNLRPSSLAEEKLATSMAWTDDGQAQEQQEPGVADDFAQTYVPFSDNTGLSSSAPAQVNSTSPEHAQRTLSRSDPTDKRALNSTLGSLPSLPDPPVINGDGPGSSAPSTATSMKAESPKGAYTNGLPVPVVKYQTPFSDSSQAGDPIAGLSEHLQYLFMTREWADWIVEVKSPISHAGSFVCHAHGVVLSRSPLLRQVMCQQLQLGLPNRVITILPPQQIQPQAFDAALRYLYTETVLTKPEIEHLFNMGSKPDTKLARTYHFEFVLSYWMAGQQLGIQAVEEQGFRLLGGFMNWDVAELAVKEALALKGFGTVETPSAMSHSARTLRPYVPSIPIEPQMQLSANAELGQSVLHVVFHFITRHLDLAHGIFDLDTTPSQVLHSYLPNLNEHSNLFRSSNPALASITFGSMPPSASLSPSTPPSTASSGYNESTANRVASAILLNLPFNELNELCIELAKISISRTGSATDADRIISQVVQERERRRVNILDVKAKLPAWKMPQNEHVWAVAGWQEYVEAKGNPHVQRKWVGFSSVSRP